MRKIILSRKGFDSGAGGVPSPIFPDGKILSLPIPTPQAPTRYGEVVGHEGAALGEIVSDLTGRPYDHLPCHLDPDLSFGALPRQAGWLPAFGQVSAAQSHLANQKVGPGDLFFFFGWFREVARCAGKWKFRRGAANIHVIFGWLQVGEILAVGDRPDQHRSARPWLSSHPHLDGNYAGNNTLYVASDRLTLGGLDAGLAGGGVFPRFDARLQLTKPGASRTLWSLPDWFLPPTGPTLTYHADPARWTRANGCVELRSVAKGQEFVMDISKNEYAAAWIKDLTAIAHEKTIVGAQ